MPFKGALLNITENQNNEKKFYLKDQNYKFINIYKYLKDQMTEDWQKIGRIKGQFIIIVDLNSNSRYG